MKKFILLASLVAVAIVIKHYDLTDYLSLEYLKVNQGRFQDYYSIHPWQSLGIYASIYILSTALSLPGAAVLTLAGGALFGLWVGTIVVSFASTIGATLAFLTSRFLFRDWVQKKFASHLQAINRGVEKEGAFYLFSLRLIPVFPFFVINLTMGLTRMPVLLFFFVSQIGMLLGTMVYVNAGVQLSQIDSLKGILSFKLLLSFAALGAMPLIAKKIISFLKVRKVYRPYKRPTSFDYNMAVIGAGSAGLVTAYISAAVKSKVVLIEKNKMGGDCLNTGCVPSKALLKSASLIHQIAQAKKYGIKEAEANFDFAEVMERVQTVIKKIEPHDSIERYQGLGVECLRGQAKIISPWEIEVDGKAISTRHITIASGAAPRIPSIEGLDKIDYLTSDNLWGLRELPRRLLVLGGGPIGLEMAQAFNRLGAQVTVVQRGPAILPREDSDIAAILLKELQDEGIEVLLNHNPYQFKENALLAKNQQGEKREINFDKVLVSVGRVANVRGFGLEELGVNLRDNGTIEANQYLQTNFPNIWVCGDVTGPFQLTHAAAHQAWFCAVNALFGAFKKFKVNYSVLPWATYTDPEVASVGQNEKSCKAQNIPYEVTCYDISDLDRAIADSSDKGLVKVLTKPGTDKIIGASIVGVQASNLLLEFVAAMKHNFGLNAILSTIHSYPTMGEANKYLAGNWKKAHKPEKILALIEKYHRWRRG